MTEIPRFGQRSTSPRQEMCPKHPGQPAVAYCKRCNRPVCSDCAIETEVGWVCVDCAGPKAKRRGASRLTGTQVAGAPVTVALIVLNVAVYIVEKIWPNVFQYLAMSPQAGYLEPWRLLTTTFVHSGFWHILFNMMMLYFLGAAVERAWGHWKFASIYLLSALAGSLAVVGWVFAAPTTLTVPTVGASGAIYGLFGAVFLVQRRSGISTSGILVLLGLNLVYAFVMPGISWQAHIGGFLGGLLVSAIYLWVNDLTERRTYRVRFAWDVAATAALTVVMGLAFWGTYAALVAHLVG